MIRAAILTLSQATALLVALVLSAPAIAQEAPAQSGTPRFEIDPTEFDFGEVWQGEHTERLFTIRNTGDAPLTLEVESSCGCTVPTKPRSPLPPGESDVMSIRYATEKRRGNANQTVTIKTNDPNRPVFTVAVRGHVKGLYTLEPTRGFLFKPLLADSAESKTVRIVNSYDAPVDFHLKEGQDWGIFKVSLNEVEKGRIYALTVKTEPPLETGAHTADIVIETGIERSPNFSIPLRVFVQPDVRLEPGIVKVSRLLMYPIQKKIYFKRLKRSGAKITGFEPSDERIKCEVVPDGTTTAGDWLIDTVRLSFPAGGELPKEDMEIKVLTDAKDPQYREMIIHVMVIGGDEEPEKGAPYPKQAPAQHP